MLGHPTFRTAIERIQETGLWKHILPTESNAELSEAAIKQANALTISSENQFQFETVLAVLLNQSMTTGQSSPLEYLERLQDQWRLKNDQIDVVGWLTRNWKTINQADTLPWSVTQPVIVHDNVWAALDVAKVLGGSQAAQDFCREALQRPRAEIDPPPLLAGKDLIDLDIRPGPIFKQILDTVRAEQLDQKLDSVDRARERAMEIFRSS